MYSNDFPLAASPAASRVLWAIATLSRQPRPRWGGHARSRWLAHLLREKPINAGRGSSIARIVAPMGRGRGISEGAPGPYIAVYPGLGVAVLTDLALPGHQAGSVGRLANVEVEASRAAVSSLMAAPFRSSPDR